MTPPESAHIRDAMDVAADEGAAAERARILAILDDNGGLRASFHAAVLSTDGDNRGYHRQGMIDTCSCAACLDDMFADFMGKARARIGGTGT